MTTAEASQMYYFHMPGEVTSLFNCVQKCLKLEAEFSTDCNLETVKQLDKCLSKISYDELFTTEDHLLGEWVKQIDTNVISFLKILQLYPEI